MGGEIRNTYKKAGMIYKQHMIISIFGALAWSWEIDNEAGVTVKSEANAMIIGVRHIKKLKLQAEDDDTFILSQRLLRSVEAAERA
eukprot:4167552-Pleurochrysis_carterae.AAC.1